MDLFPFLRVSDDSLGALSNRLRTIELLEFLLGRRQLFDLLRELEPHAFRQLDGVWNVAKWLVSYSSSAAKSLAERISPVMYILVSSLGKCYILPKGSSWSCFQGCSSDTPALWGTTISFLNTSNLTLSIITQDSSLYLISHDWTNIRSETHPLLGIKTTNHPPGNRMHCIFSVSL